MDTPNLVTILLFFAGAVITFMWNYIKFTNEFNFIKGQLTQILELHDEFSELFEKYGIMGKELTKSIKDLDSVRMRVRMLETKLAEANI